MDRGAYELTGMLPRPGRALKAVLGLIGGLCLLNWTLFNWVPGGKELFYWLACTTDGVVHKLCLWKLITAGFLTKPTGPGSVSYLLYTLIGLYFLSPDLETRWGSARFLRFVGLSMVVGFLLGIGADLLAPPHLGIFHPPIMYGAGAAITGTAVAWSRQNADRQFRLFFVLPMRGSWLFWLAVLYCVLGVIAWDENGDTGVVAPFGGLVTGLLLGGTPSVLRSIYLRAKLALLRKQADEPGRSNAPRPSRSTRQGGPPLRVVYGGIEDELKKRKPPKDKRYLN
jgi:membrane associated rhomboid family serine protease